MSKISVMENFLSNDEFAQVKNVFLNNSFPWYFNSQVVSMNENDTDNFQFTHIFYGEELTPFRRLLEKLNSLSLLRIKANLLTKTHKHIEHGMHVDVDDPKVTTAVFYINTNNGYTLFENGQKVYSKENTLVTFPSQLLHSGATCTDQKVRIVLNLNYIERT